MRYWDSSAMVPLLVAEPSSEKMRTSLRADSEMLAWWGSPLECISALSRKERQGALSSEAMIEGLARLKELQAQWIEIEPHEKVRELARRLIRIHQLRAADSLQLAAAMIGSEQESYSLDFICFDDRLRVAAEREGFPVYPPKLEV